MSCCGNRRTGAAMPPPQRIPAAVGAGPSADGRRSSVAYFQYSGSGGIVVTGPATGRRYRFDASGAVVAVDLADRMAVAALAHLRQVPRP